MHREIWGQAAYDATYAQGPRSSTRERTRAAGFGSIAIGVLFVLFGLAPSAANATQPNPEHKVTLCHATDSYSNPYVRITVDVASVLHHNGHDGHNGPIFYPAIPKHTKWGDIIPPFNFGPNEQYAGKNWTSTGITIFNNGCNGPGTPTTTTTTHPVTTTTPAPTTTSTVPGATTTSSTPPTTTTTSSIPGATTTTAPGGTTTSIPTVTTAGGSTTTEPGVTSTTISQETVVTLGTSTTAAPGNNPLPFTGGNSGAAIFAGLVLIAAGFGLTRRMPSRP